MTLHTAGVTIAATELRRITRDRTDMIVVVLVPVLIVLIVGLNFLPDDETQVVGVIDLDQTTASAAFVDALAESAAITTRPYESPEAIRSDVGGGDIAAGVTIPAGFGAGASTGTDLRLVVETQRGNPAAGAARSAVDAAGASFSTELAAGRIIAEATNLDFDEAVDAAGTEVDEVAGTRITVQEATADTPSDDAASFVGFRYAAPGILVLFTFMNSLVLGERIVAMRKLGVARRVLVSPARPTDVIAGLGLSRLLFALAQGALLILLGWVFFRVDWGDPLGVAALIVAFGVTSAGGAMLIGALAASREQARAIAVPVGMALAMLGGAIWPLSVVPSFMQTIGHVSPHAWAMDSWIDLVFEDRSATEILPAVGVLLAFGVVLFGLAVWQLQRTLAADNG